VEVMGRYLNHSDQGERLRDLLEMVPSGSQTAKTRTKKQVCRRLRPAEIEELLAGYKAGVPIKALVAQFKIDRSTVTNYVKRAGVRLRLPALLPKEIEEASRLYRSGQSLRQVGSHFGVRDTTIRTALLRAGVQMRDCQGRERI
jgi:hypothetical protein